MSRDNVEIGRKAYESFERGDLARHMNEYWLPDIEWRGPDGNDLPGAGTHRGQADVVNKALKPFLDEFDDFKLEPEEYYDAGDVLVVTGRLRGRGRRGRRAVDSRFCHIFHMDGGKCRRIEIFGDTDKVRRAVGR